MAEYLKDFKFKMSFDKKDIKKNLDEISADMKAMLAEMGKASDKMPMFKQMAEYLESIGTALRGIGATNTNSLGKLFAGIDADLLGQMENMFRFSLKDAKSISGMFQQLSQIESGSLKPTTKMLRDMAETLDGLYASAGMKSQIDLGSFFGKTGKEGTADRVNQISTALKGLASILGNINPAALSGFGDGSFASSFGGIADGLADANSEISKQLDELEKQKKRYQEIVDIYDDKPINIKVNSKNSATLLKETVDEYKRVTQMLDSEEFKNTATEEEKTKLMAEQLRLATRLESIQKSNTKWSQRATDIAINERETLTHAETFLTNHRRVPASSVAKNKKQKERDAISSMFRREIINTSAEMAALRESVVTIDDGFVSGSGGANDSPVGKMVSEAEELQILLLQLERLFDNINSTSGSIEYKVLINGREFDILQGGNKEISEKTMMEAYLGTLGKQRYVSAHNHPGGTSSQTDSYDFANIMDDVYTGVTAMGMTVGEKDITTLDFSKVNIDDAQKVLKQIQELEKAGAKSVSAEKINEMFRAINPEYGDVAKMWDASQLKELATYIRDIGESANISIDPLTQFQNILKLATKGKIDLSKYQGLFDNFNVDNATSVFNQIMEAEGRDFKVDSASVSSLSDFVNMIKQQKEAFVNLRNEAKVTYSDIHGMVQRYAASAYAGDIDTDEFDDFIKRYFGRNDQTVISDLLIGLENGEASILQVTNRIAGYFHNIDPSEYLTDVMAATQQAQVKLQEFVKLKETIVGNVDWGTDDVEVGTYIGKLESTRQELRALGEQGLLTADELEEVERLFEASKSHLNSHTKGYTGYGSGSGYYYNSYEDEYMEARARVETLEGEVEALEKEREYDDNKVISDFNNTVTEIKDLGVQGLNPDEIARYVSQLQALYNQMEAIYDRDGMSDGLMFEKTDAFKEATEILAQAKEKEETYKELLRLNDQATLTTEEDGLRDIVQKRRELTTLAETEGWFDEETLQIQKAITDEVEKRIGLQKTQGGTDVPGATTLGAILGYGDGTGEASVVETKNISDEIQQLENLKAILLEVEQAIQLKTQAFREEGTVVDQVVQREIEALRQLLLALGYVKSAVENINNSFAGASVTDIPALKTGATQSDTSELPATNTQYALENTLLNTNGILQNILDQLGSADTFNGLVDPLKSAVAELTKVSNGIIEEHKRKAVDTRDADARIVDPQSRADIEQAVFKAVAGRTADGGAVDITGMSSMANGMVKVSGVIQTATNEWEEFTLQVDKANQVSHTAYKTNTKATEAAVKAAEEAKKVAQERESATNNIAKEIAKKERERELLKITGQVNIEKGTLGFNFNARDLKPEQQEIVALYDDLIAEVDKYEIAVKHGQQAELTGVEEIKKALFDKIDTYKQANNIVNAGRGGNKKAYGATVVKNATTKYQGLSNRVNGNSELAGSDVVNSKLAQYTAAYEHLIDLQKKYKVGQALNPEQEQEFNNAKLACSGYAKELEKIINLHAKTNTEDSVHWGLEGDFKDDFAGRRKVFNDFLEETYGSTATFEKFTDDYNKMIYTVKNGDGTFTRMTAVINNTRTAIDTMAGEARETTTVLAAFWNELKGKFKSIGAYVIASFSIHDIIRYVRTGVQYVREIDAALTELKKVTNETDAAYNKFLQNMSKTAGMVGSTIKDLTNSAADWARLGYSMQEAGELAKNTSILMNVSEFEDVSKATDTLISALQAFKKEGQDVGQFSMDIIDKYNEVGNNYAISTSDLADSLTRSSAALVAANNSLEQSIAMTAAANTTIQDPESVGNALKTVSMRIRGVKTELEEAGEDTEGMVENTAKLQEKIMALTNIDGKGGINILTESGDFKSTYDILLAISKVWKDIDDVSQAALLELVAGKTRGSVVASLFQNGDILESAFESASNASGSATEELDNHLNSIQGRIDILTNSFQTMWMNFLNTDVVKFVINLTTSLVKLTDTIGLLPTLIGAFAGIKMAAKELKPIFDGTSVSTKQLKKNLNEYLNQQIHSTEATYAQAAASEANAGAKTQEAAATNAAATADQSEAATSTANATANATQATASETVQQEKAQEAASVNSAAAADATESATSTANAAANASQAAGASGFASSLGNVAGMASKVGAAIKVIGLAAGKAALIMAAVSLATKAIGAAWEWLDKEVIHRAENIKQKTEELTSAFEDTKKTLDDNLKTLSTSSDTELYSSLEDEFARLTKGVDRYGNNISLTTDQYERYKEICEKIVGINPSIAQGYDNATKAIGNNANALSQLIELQKIQARQNASEYTKDDNLKTIAEDAINSYNTAKTTYNNELNEGINYANESAKIAKKIQDSIVKSRAQNSHLTGSVSAVDEYDVFSILGYNDLWLEDGFDDDPRDVIDTYYNDILTKLKEAAAQGGSILHEYAGSGEIIEISADDVASIAFELEEYVKAHEDALKYAEKQVEEAQDGFISALLQVPASMSEYDNLSDANKSWVTEWIKNSEMFKIDDETTQEDILEAKAEIRKFMTDIADEKYYTTTDSGAKITASDVLDSIFNLDTSDVSWEKYQNDFQALLWKLWDAIGGKDNTLGFETATDLALSLGFDMVEQSDNQSQMYKRYAEIKDITTNEAREYFESLPAETVQRLLQVDWNLVDENNVDDVINPDIASNMVITQSYSSLVESVTAYNEVLAQTQEILYDGIEVTQAYKDALTELGLSEEQLNECFDETNPLVVKNADALNDLLKSSKDITAQNAQLARSQARLKYYEVYKEMSKYISANGEILTSDIKVITAHAEELKALSSVIKKYSLLEQQLLGTTSAYDKFAEAQTNDSESDYLGKTEEMITSLIEAYHTGDLGTETTQVAMDALIPDSVFEGLKTAEERAAAAKKYIDEVLALYYDIQYDEEGNLSSVTAKFGNARKLIKDGLSKGVFSGEDYRNFEFDPNFLSELSESEDKMATLAKYLNVSKEVAFAWLQELDNKDISWMVGNYSSLFDVFTTQTLEDKINNTTQSLANLHTQLAEGNITVEDYIKGTQGLEGLKRLGKISDEDYAAQKADADEKLAQGQIDETDYTRIVHGETAVQDQLAGQARENADAYTEAKKAYDEAAEAVKDCNKELKKAQEVNDPEKIQQATKNLAEAEKKLWETYDALEACGTPTEVTLTVAKEQVKADIDDALATIQTLVSEKDYKLLANLDITTLGEPDENGNYAINLETQLDEAGTQAVQQYLDYLAEEHNINILQGEGAVTTLDVLNDIKDILSQTYDLMINTSDAETKTTSFIDLWNSIKDKTVTLTQQVKSVASGIVDFFTGGKESKVNGTAHMSGTAYAGGSWGTKSTEEALVGELGKELMVDSKTGTWRLIGEHGAEFTTVPRGSIIFNHKQTEEILKNGHITSRGKAYAMGTNSAGGKAYASGFTSYTGASVIVYPDAVSKEQWEGTGYTGPDGEFDLEKALENIDSAGSSAKDFEETLDWIEIRLEEWDETIGKLNSELENMTGYLDKNKKIDEIINASYGKKADLKAGADYYEQYAQKYLNQLSGDYRTFAQNGAIAVEDFAGEADEKTVEAINKYREYIQKSSDLRDQEEQLVYEIRQLSIQQIDNAQHTGDVKVAVEDSQTEKLQTAVDFDEARGIITDPNYYAAMMENSERSIAYLTEARNAMQKEFDDAVAKGDIKVGDDNWYENLDKLYKMDIQINKAKISMEEFQNSINDIYWEGFDEVISNFENVSEEAQGLIDILSSEDMFTEPDYENGWDERDVQWTKEGLATLGLHAQEMERAEAKAQAYATAIDDLAREYHAGHYSESEYNEKLAELTKGQMDAIKAAKSEKDAIVDLNKSRVEAIKNGINKQIEAYEKLIEKKKESLDAEKDIYDFQKSVQEQQKDISAIERKIAALSGDNSASAIAQRKKLEAELAEAKAALQETYYERSIENQQTALDNELETFQEAKEKEIETWDKYLEDVETVVAESLGIVKENAVQIGSTLATTASEYNLTISDAILDPWKDGHGAIDTYTKKFGDSVSPTTQALKTIKDKWDELKDAIALANAEADKYYSKKDATADSPSVADFNAENKKYYSNPTGAKASTNSGSGSGSNGSGSSGSSGSSSNKSQSTPAIGSTVKVESSATKFGSKSGSAAMASFVRGGSYTVYDVSNGQALIGRNGAYTGWVNLSDLQGYAKGTKGVKKNELAWIDENGLEELVMHAGPDGRLQYLSKGTSVLNSDLTNRIMDLAMNPQEVLDRNRPSIGLHPEIHNTQIQIDNSIGELIHIDKCDQSTLPDVEKIVNKALDKHMQTLNNSLKRFTR